MYNQLYGRINNICLIRPINNEIKNGARCFYQKVVVLVNSGGCRVTKYQHVTTGAVRGHHG